MLRIRSAVGLGLGALTASALTVFGLYLQAMRSEGPAAITLSEAGVSMSDSVPKTTPVLSPIPTTEETR